jgi:hypothetical protein
VLSSETDSRRVAVEESFLLHGSVQAMAAKARFLILAAATWVCLSEVAVSAFDVPSVAFEEGFSPLFGDENLVRSRDDWSVRLLLDRRSGNPSPSLQSS